MKKLLLLILLVPSIIVNGQTKAEREKITSNYNMEKLKLIEQQFSTQFNEDYNEALRLAKIKNWPLNKVDKNGNLSMLIGVHNTGEPIYYTELNFEAGETSRANTLYPGGSLGLNLTGAGMTAGIWDGGSARVSHELFEGRVTLGDGSSSSAHSTHCAGTIIGSDAFKNGDATGMAYEANLTSYKWNNDLAEMTTEAAGGMLISSHSYGIPASSSPSYYLGKYDEYARDLDDIIYNAPYYLPSIAAGNDRTAGINSTGYDILTGMGCNKNAMTVAAVYEVTNYTGPSSVVMSSFSSWGPTDDGRIKPDISAKGVDMYSSKDNSNSSYGTMSGTSMACPSVAGTLVLLQQHYNNVNGNFMLASTLRGLALHTADEAGNSDGPDYEFGWGLINARRAAEAITNNGNSSIINEIILNPGQTYTINVTASGLEDLMATIAWTDIEGVVGPNTVDDRTPILINDLDIRITQGGSTNMPWKLDPGSPSNAATQGDNIVDNIEKVEITSPSGIYTITITHKGILTGGGQTFSLIVTGLIGNDCNGVFGGTAYFDNCGVCVGGNTGLTPCISYCTSTYTESGSEYISNVQFNTINNASGDATTNGYEDYTSMTTTVVPGMSYTIDVTVNTVGNYTDHCQVFFDWNYDGDFYDTGEMVDLGDITNVTSGVLSGNVVVPAGATLNTIIMRVNIEYNVNPEPCDQDHTSEWGETEDYSIIISSVDCNGDVGGTAEMDSCGTCVGGNTGLIACIQDCYGDWGGTAVTDNCGICVDGNTGLTACAQDCHGDWGGTAVTDNCGTCVDGNTGLIACIQDCNTDWGGMAIIDSCGICAGGNTGIIPIFNVSGCITGIQTNTVDALNIYPNPFENSFTLQLSGNIAFPVNVEVLDYLGRKVHTQTITTSATEIILNNQLSSGTYFLKVMTESTQIVKRIIKMK
ncbi:MAG: hypothetical protein COB15_04465 [Flavobacteriales bacterium]|nr:MAG: hypothetical protein COB15_04465 [Flavobacteriales bacterium]